MHTRFGGKNGESFFSGITAAAAVLIGGTSYVGRGTPFVGRGRRANLRDIAICRPDLKRRGLKITVRPARLERATFWFVVKKPCCFSKLHRPSLRVTEQRFQ